MCIYTYKLYIHILKEIHQNILTGFNPLVLGFYFLSLFPSVPYHIIYAYANKESAELCFSLLIVLPQFELVTSQS